MNTRAIHPNPTHAHCPTKELEIYIYHVETTTDLFSAMRLQDNALYSDAISLVLHLSLLSTRFPSIIPIIHFMPALILHLSLLSIRSPSIIPIIHFMPVEYQVPHLSFQSSTSCLLSTRFPSIIPIIHFMPALILHLSLLSIRSPSIIPIIHFMPVEYQVPHLSFQSSTSCLLSTRFPSIIPNIHFMPALILHLSLLSIRSPSIIPIIHFMPVEYQVPHLSFQSSTSCLLSSSTSVCWVSGPHLSFQSSTSCLLSTRFPSIIPIIHFMPALILHEKSIQCFRKSNISLKHFCQNVTNLNVNPKQEEATEFLPLTERMFPRKTSFISCFPKQNENKNKFTGQAVHSTGGVSTIARNEGPVPWYGMR